MGAETFDLPSAACIHNIDSHAGKIFLLLLEFLLASQCSLKNPNLYPRDNGPNVENNEHFDYIFVGAGTSGSVAVSEMVEKEKYKILLVEAGDMPSVTAEIPGLFIHSQLTNQIWNYHTEPSNASCLSYNNGLCHWPRGKLLGGCSSINAMLYLRGNERDYDSWQNNGNEGWNYTSIKQYFQKSEHLIATNLKNSNAYGKEGLLALSNYKMNDTLREALLKSAKDIGYDILDEEGPLGFFESLQTIEHGVRYNAAKMIIGRNNKTDKLTLALNAHVEKVLIDKESKKAEGIKVKIGQKTLNVYADKEVILSAGAINSPQILMLSGIGPKEHLNKLGIEVIQDLEVGQNLQDHLMMFVFSKLSDDAINSPKLLDEIYKYFIYQDGLFSKISHLNVIGLLNTKNDSKYPDIEFMHMVFMKENMMALETFIAATELNSDIAANLRNFNRKHNILVTVIVLLQPKSRGNITLKDSNPYVHPTITAGYLTDEKGDDLETFLRGIRLAEARLRSEVFKKLDTEVMDIGIPNCRNFKFDTDDYWKCAVKNIATSLYHPTSTCKMGPKSDKSAVVDSRLKVHGVKNLRVIDASIMPNIVSANTQAACYMIGQKGAHMISEDQKSAEHGQHVEQEEHQEL
ncbi:hypothetical protein WA026_015218 [Henosepilachna vigintioctopunctata]|uniref:Glucose-methanol-choline oxidoreductase N-terminal domain-containing protein n=1 Tax=Henosepilachna vigintioctopunctata TaxID=420089 RepID=A0AAW1TUB6_9CUCU